MYTVDPKSGERFFLRLLLLHVVGATSFEYLRTVNGVLYNTFKEAAFKRNLLVDDKEWEAFMEEASTFLMPIQLRQSFAFICIFCQPENPNNLWEKFKKCMIEDFAHTHTDSIAINMALSDIEKVLHDHGFRCSNFNLPVLTLIAQDDFHNNDLEAAEALKLITKLNFLQKSAFDLIVQSIENNDFPQRCFYIDGAGGSGKTFLYNTLMCYIRGRNQIVLPFATTGIAAILLKGGRTIHS
ncbi:unnamed protein product [Gordionus sp. m RMFG-2023]